MNAYLPPHGDSRRCFYGCLTADNWAKPIGMDAIYRQTILPMLKGVIDFIDAIPTAVLMS